MQEYTVVIKSALGKGLRPSKHSPRNADWLFSTTGCIPEDKVLQTIPELDRIPFFSGEIFPFPQWFRLRDIVLVCGKQNIYEYIGGDLVLQHMSANAGWTWSIADFGDYLAMTNGASLVIRDGRSRIFEEYDDCKIPPCLCICDYNGQIVLGGPGMSVAEGFTGE